MPKARARTNLPAKLYPSAIVMEGAVIEADVVVGAFCFVAEGAFIGAGTRVAVMIDEPSAGQYFGGKVAAPVFREVVQQTLRMMGVQPDMAVIPQIVAAVEESI